MQAGNARYLKQGDLPETIPIFPLSGALLLPGGRMPLNIFEPRYLQLLDHAIAGTRLLGIVQPALDGGLRADGEPELCAVGCLGRVTSFAESGDGRYLITLQGVCRFRIVQELAVKTPFRQCRATPFLADLGDDPAASSWLSDYLELTELHVRPDAQGARLGEGLLRALLTDTGHGRVLLSTPEYGERQPGRAWRLYRRTGFVDVLRHHRFTGDARRRRDRKSTRLNSSH